jgi:small conductance mechanosensitive channel
MTDIPYFIHPLRKSTTQQVTERAAIQNSEAVVAQTIDGNLPEAEAGQWLFLGLRHQLGLQQRLQTARFLHWLLFWLIGLIWVVGIAYSLNTFPQTRYIARKVAIIPIFLLLVWFFTGLVNRLTDLATDRFIQSREQEKSLTAANLQRITTIANVIKGLKMVLLYTISFLWVLQWLKLASGTLLTLGAVVALAVSFAAQNLVKDFVNGFLILLEDQFRIGDMIRIGTVVGLGAVEGLVENLNLRITQLRSPAGNLITLPNSTIAQVENMSRTWARADFQIEVAYNTDVDRALAVVRETLDQMVADPEWEPLILDTHEVFGVEQLTNTGIVIRVWIKTMPLKQWVIARELRRRLKIAFDRHNIQIGIPQQLWLESDNNNSVLQSSQEYPS